MFGIPDMIVRGYDIHFNYVLLAHLWSLVLAVVHVFQNDSAQRKLSAVLAGAAEGVHVCGGSEGKKIIIFIRMHRKNCPCVSLPEISAGRS